MENKYIIFTTKDMQNSYNDIVSLNEVSRQVIACTLDNQEFDKLVEETHKFPLDLCDWREILIPLFIRAQANVIDSPDDSIMDSLYDEVQNLSQELQKIYRIITTFFNILNIDEKGYTALESAYDWPTAWREYYKEI